MDNPRIARWFFGLTSALVTFGILLQLEVAVNNDNALFDGAAARTVNVLSYFTVQSNILVALTTGLLALRLNRTLASIRSFVGSWRSSPGLIGWGKLRQSADIGILMSCK